LGSEQISRPRKLLYFDPVRVGHFRRAWQTGTSDDDFVVKFVRDINMRKNPMEEVKTAEFG